MAISIRVESGKSILSRGESGAAYMATKKSERIAQMLKIVLVARIFL